ncbi:hypothetical protein M406DRAFT_269736 [Cryphonectria parasitica EP155]|uniref:Uncharacterized protein n=1 Tax=Cryphonectria parasitica (strain ATCC 38755 / EP155) TaxID=660469 RepID=A0A9P4XRX8_CRYP1|nr:uncharacterized protein M406DRAFT_269736 [Cryphonectria parasitica EP155]KAF3760329.1 hypothetical protein M406DRAFT_269736 [Cryphonectria parasitica EP155]
MCHQITYTLPCEHVRTDIVYCADAPESGSRHSHSAGGSGGGGGASSSSKSKRDSGKKSSHRGSATSSREKGKSQHHHHHGSSRSSSAANKRKPCRNLTTQAIAYPLPPSFEGDPSTAALSPLLPKCPLPRCPFEALNRCWNCCWCGKGWNEQGRCSCIMIIEGTQVRCEHICCETCTPAGPM